MRTTASLLTSLIALPLVASFAIGCGDKSAASGSASAVADTSTATSAAPKKAGEVPKDADPAVVAELKKVGACEREEGRRKDGCEAQEAWEKYFEKFVEEDDLNLTKQKKLAKACFSLVNDEKENVRETAYDCVGQFSDGIEDRAAVLAVVMSKIESETNNSVQSSMFNVIDEMDPTKNGYAPEVLKLAKKLIERENTSYEVGRLVAALTPEKPETEPTDEAFAFAVELIQKKKAGYNEAIQLVTRAPKKAKEACSALLTLVETKKHGWAAAVDGMSKVEGACKEQADKVIEVVVAKAGEGEGYDKGFIGADVIYFERLLEKGIFSAEQKAKVKTAVEPLLEKAKEDHQKKTYQSLLDKLK